ncbi:MAG: transporter [Pseudomonadota bacterium]
MFNKRATFVVACSCLFVNFSADADTVAHDHGPIGVMGDHTHQAGEVMFSYRYMNMYMKDSRDGTDDLNLTEIVTRESSPFGPPTLRVVPRTMRMQMHMLGVMWAPSDRLTLMGMFNYVESEMSHTTFMGMAGSNILGRFSTSTKGVGDTQLSALINIGETHHGRWHATLGVSLPTGDFEESDQILTPMNTRPTVVLPYPMQLGSGTTDLIAGLTYAGFAQRWGWGGQWRSLVRLGENHNDYTLGDEHQVQGWLSYLINTELSMSARLSYKRRGNIDGMDAQIAAPVQTADPNRHAYDRIDVSVGSNIVIPNTDHRIGLELTTPVYQNLDGPQMKSDWHLTLGWQLAL